MKKVFIYYSMTGSGDVVADYYKEKGYEIKKVISKYKYPKSFFMLMMVGGFRALTNKKDKLIDFDTNINDYDEVVIGSPVWFDRVPSPTNSVINKLDLSNKKVKFVFYSGSGEATKAKEKINKLFDAEIIVLKEPKKYKEELSKL